MSRIKDMNLISKIFASMLLGGIAGELLNSLGTLEWSQIWLIDGAFRVVGQVFISLLKMLVVPLVFVSLVLFFFRKKFSL